MDRHPESWAASLRVPLPSREGLAPEIAELLDLATPPGGEPPATVAVLAHHPDLLPPFLSWAAALALNGALSRRDHELLALRTSWQCHSQFEWDEHAEYARAAGLSDDEIDRVAEGPDASGWEPHDAALLRAADELCQLRTITEATWTTLGTRLGPPQLVEIPYVVGQYAMLSMVANAVGIDPQPKAR